MSSNEILLVPGRERDISHVGYMITVILGGAGAAPTKRPVVTKTALRGSVVSKDGCAMGSVLSISICPRAASHAGRLMSPALVWNANWVSDPSTRAFAMKSLPIQRSVQEVDVVVAESTKQCDERRVELSYFQGIKIVFDDVV